MTTQPPAAFDVVRDLPPAGATTLLEASAGTGKTYAVAALVTRYVAEGIAPLEQMLVITFGRAASQELRDRVRAQLVEAERALGGAAVAEPSELLTHLLDADPDERAARHRRLREALASFDAATIATTHQFCQLVLRSLGVAGDSDPGATLVDTLEDLVEEVVDDLLLQRYGDSPGRPPLRRADAMALALAAIGDPQARLAPEAYDLDTTPGQRVDFARAVRAEVERRKRRQRLLSYDDLLSRLADALEQEDAPARERMRQRWSIVLVDEFQDTDPVQWQVIDRAFTGHATVVLIGDPKQSIYAFRGGDVVTYLQAGQTAGAHATLTDNWRSDAPLVESLQVLLGGAALGDPGIVVRPVRPRIERSRLQDAPVAAPFRLRVLERTDIRLNREGLVQAGEARRRIAADCAADIARLLASSATFDGRPVRAADVAVLVAVRHHGELVQSALAELGIPAVVTGTGHVFLTPAAEEWLALLEALEQPQRATRVRAAALTSFIGHTTAELDAGGEELTDQVADRLRGWALLLRSRGVAALVEAFEEQQLTERVLGVTDGERHLTDIRHIAQTLHDTSVRDRLGLAALIAWFREERRRNQPTTDRTRRLDSDAAAVQIVTIHGAKGLQYPVVHMPFAYASHQHDVDVARYHDADGRRTLDVSQGGAQWADAVRQHRKEEAGEELRDLYVALTRAQSQVVCWWAPTAATPHSGLHRMIFGRGPGVAEVPLTADVPSDARAAETFAAVAAVGGPAYEPMGTIEATPLTWPTSEAPLAVRSLDRTIDTDWRRTSYSGLIRIEEQAPPETDLVGSEPEEDLLDDEPVTPEAEPPADPAELPGHLPSPMADMPAGAAFGSLVHGVLEHLDPTVPDLTDELTRIVAEQLRWWPVAAEPADIAAALLPLQHSPLGPLAPGSTLAQVPLSDRLRELEFEFPLAHGDRSGETGAGRLRDVAPLMRELLPADDPLLPYADRLTSPLLGDQELRGYLSGSVDVVLRVPDPTAPDSRRFVVVDYKTNLLGEPALPVTTADYTADRLAAAMVHSHYPLQAMLYSVVTHRYLRWRLPGYDPRTHLGGVAYLYLRGMAGPDTPVIDGHPTGVFSWRPPAEFVEALSDLLAGRRP